MACERFSISHTSTAMYGQGTGGHGRAFAHEDSNLTARRLFLPEKYPSPITTDRVSQTSGISGSGVFDLKSKAPCPTPPGDVLNLCGKSAEDRLARPERRPIATQPQNWPMLPA